MVVGWSGFPAWWPWLLYMNGCVWLITCTLLLLTSEEHYKTELQVQRNYFDSRVDPYTHRKVVTIRNHSGIPLFSINPIWGGGGGGTA